jgi:hypothetical protein
MRAAMASIVVDLWAMANGVVNGQMSNAMAEKVWSRASSWGAIGTYTYTTITKTTIYRSAQADAAYITTDDNKEMPIEDQITQLENNITNSKTALETTKYSDLKIQKIYENMMNEVIKRNINKLNELKGRI